MRFIDLFGWDESVLEKIAVVAVVTVFSVSVFRQVFGTLGEVGVVKACTIEKPKIVMKRIAVGIFVVLKSEVMRYDVMQAPGRVFFCRGIGSRGW